MTLPCFLSGAPTVITGSHLDSVPCAGNFDGAAGVLAGIAVLASWVVAGYRPRRDVTVMAIRAEESAWFPISYLCSKAAFGLLSPSAMQTPRADNGRPLALHWLLRPFGRYSARSPARCGRGAGGAGYRVVASISWPLQYFTVIFNTTSWGDGNCVSRHRQNNTSISD